MASGGSPPLAAGTAGGLWGGWLPWAAPPGRLRARGGAPPLAASTADVLWWRWLPWTAPRVRLSARVRPQTPLELALCALFRCQREWPARALVVRLAQAPLGSDDNLARLGLTRTGGV